MIQIKTMKHIATSQMIPGVRSLASSGPNIRCTGHSAHHRAADLGRIHASLGQMQRQESRRVWLNQQWTHHPSQHRTG